MTALLLIAGIWIVLAAYSALVYAVVQLAEGMVQR